MEQLATPESIRLTAATRRLVEGLVQVTALGPVPVKGLAEPVEVRRTRGLELRIRVGLHSGEDDHGRGPSGLAVPRSGWS